MKRSSSVLRRYRLRWWGAMAGVAGGAALLTYAGSERQVPVGSALVEVSLPPSPVRHTGDLLELELAMAQLQIGLRLEEPGPSAERALDRSWRASGGADAGDISTETAQFILRTFNDDGWRLLALLRCYGGYAAGREQQPPAAALNPALALSWLIGWQEQCFGQQWALKLFGHYRQHDGGLADGGAGWGAQPADCDVCRDLHDHVGTP